MPLYFMPSARPIRNVMQNVVCVFPAAQSIVKGNAIFLMDKPPQLFVRFCCLSPWTDTKKHMTIPSVPLKIYQTQNTNISRLSIQKCTTDVRSNVDKFRKAGFKPFALASILYLWLVGGGYCLAKFVVPVL
jgi:hypothetical protein